ncbi:hypothetical protein QJQ45_020380 [Haematococcus lacustris]|nr:hypothetical protein QJQ45_020380 [Haematococcus lacustris]
MTEAKHKELQAKYPWCRFSGGCNERGTPQAHCSTCLEHKPNSSLFAKASGGGGAVTCEAELAQHAKSKAHSEAIGMAQRAGGGAGSIKAVVKAATTTVVQGTYRRMVLAALFMVLWGHSAMSTSSLPLTVGHQQATAAAAAGARPLKVVGMGSCGVDYLASVAAFPKPDEKLRTDRLEVQGGGNAANALTAAARLGLQPLLVSKIGGDGLGDSILEELEGEGIDTSQVLRAAGSPSPFTYIIVDRQGGTRTCIHTPGEAFAPEEVTEQLRQHSLQDARLVYFDGRLTEAALLLAAAARAAGVPVLVEAERLRPGLDQLLQLADCVVTSATFPQAWTGEPLLSDALLASAQRLPRARFLLTTLGSAGSVMLVPQPDGAVGSSSAEEDGSSSSRSSSSSRGGRGQSDQAGGEGLPLGQVMDQLRSELAAGAQGQGQEGGAGAAGAAGGQAGAAGTSSGAGPRPDCISPSGVAVRRGAVASTSRPLALAFSPDRCQAQAVQLATEAATQAAALNADPGNASAYQAAGPQPVQEATDKPAGGLPAGAAVLMAEVMLAAPAGLPEDAVVDTTGAGDAFIGSVLYALAHGLPLPKMMQLASLVAASKCTQLGARPGLPHCSSIAPDLLS